MNWHLFFMALVAIVSIWVMVFLGAAAAAKDLGISNLHRNWIIGLLIITAITCAIAAGLAR